MSPERLREKYHEALMEVYSLSGICKRLWGTTAWKNFFYPMNFGFRSSLFKMMRG
jgi:hypothetical protein